MKKIIHTKEAPEPIGPYSQAIQISNFIFTSGQIAIDSESGEIVRESVEKQTELVIRNLQSVLHKADCSLDDVVKTTIYLKNMNDFSAVNSVYAGFFDQSKPARSTVEVSRLPKDVLVEIDCIAFRAR